MLTMNFQKSGRCRGTFFLVHTLSTINCTIFLPRVEVVETAILNIHGIHSLLSASPLTLIHNDCNPRNLCLRKPDRVSEEGNIRTCLYDWELAAIDVPQRDVVEFLAFTLMPCTAQNARLELLDFYRCNLEHFTGITYPLDRY